MSLVATAYDKARGNLFIIIFLMFIIFFYYYYGIKSVILIDRKFVFYIYTRVLKFESAVGPVMNNFLYFHEVFWGDKKMTVRWSMWLPAKSLQSPTSNGFTLKAVLKM